MKRSVAFFALAGVSLLTSAQLHAGSILYTAVWGGANGGELESFDASNPTAVTDIGPLGVFAEFGGLAYDSANSTLYLIDGQGNGSTSTNSLYTVNIATGAATLVGAHGITDLLGLTYDSGNNTLYAAQGQSNSPLEILNTGTGAATAVGTQISASSDEIGTLAYDSANSTLYGLFDCIGCSVLYSIDPSTGAGTVLANTGLDTNNSGLVFDPATGLLWDLDVEGRISTIDPVTHVQTQVASFTAGEPSGLALIAAQSAPVPEPSTFALFGAGAAMLWIRRRLYGR